jgi:hypothetical protein
MPQFIHLRIEPETSAPDPAKVKATHNVYMERLKLADELPLQSLTA